MLLSDEFINQYKDKKVMNQLGSFVYYRTYSRYLENEHRREYWYETVRRAVEYNCSLDKTVTVKEAEALYDNVFNLRQFLSGRTMWVGGTKVAKDFPMSNFNCAFEVVDNLHAFSELLYLLMLGSGVGVRILKDDVSKIELLNDIPLVNEKYKYNKNKQDDTQISCENGVVRIVVGDSKNGWSDAMMYYLDTLTNDTVKEIRINYDYVRPQGYPLKTFGGTASGHKAIENMFTKINKLIKKYACDGKLKLKPIDCLDIANIIGEGVVVGGVRRTAEIMLFDSDDMDCITAKDSLYRKVGDTWKPNKEVLHRSMSNNSIYYTKKPNREQLHSQLERMRYSGEPAWVNAEAGAKRRPNMNGVNPCGEILLDDKGMCNLTTVNVMAFVENGALKFYDLLEAQALSARASYRMTMIDLELDNWNKTQKKDRLLGCSLTGWQDMVNTLHLDKDQEIYLLTQLRLVAHEVAKHYSNQLDLAEPLLVTTIKPEGTLSQLPTVSSGVHYSHSPYYIRRVRINANDALVKVCEELGYNINAEVGQTLEDCTTKVIDFPVKAPIGKTKYDVSAIEQLENYKMFMKYYVDHNCSITVHVRDNEWSEVEQWIWDNWDEAVAISFLSLDDSFYQLMPYEAITKEEYDKLIKNMKPFDSSLISKYEKREMQFDIGQSECVGGICPIR